MIIGGAWKRKKIFFRDAEGLRPTLGRIRETLFNWLGQDLSNKKCLDLFSGSGSLGFEALSRNASSCTFIERNYEVYLNLIDNKIKLNVERAFIKNMNAELFIKNNSESFDIIFCDPPFKMNETLLLIDRLRQLLNPEGIIYFESDQEIPEQMFEIHKTSRVGKVYFYLIR